jgi:hypothetical protein
LDRKKDVIAMEDPSYMEAFWEGFTRGVGWLLANPFDFTLASKIEGLLQETKTYVESLFY